MKRFSFTILLVTLLALTACGRSTNIEPTPGSDVENLIQTAAALTLQASTQAAEAQATEVPTETPIPTMPPTPTRDTSAPVTVLSPLMNLRTGPGTLFDIVATFSEGTIVYATGMTPAGDWLYISAPVAAGDTWTGWLAAAYLDTTEIETALPILTWPEENTLRGHVADNQAEPVSGIRVAAEGQGNLAGIRSEGVSDQDGNFYIYLPKEINGTFNVEIVAVNCTSNIADVQPDGGCQADDHFTVNWQAEAAIPQTSPVIFSYERAAAFLEGKVVYQDGNGASEVLVRATRISDEVTSEKVTPVGGGFKLPLGIGTWEVVAVRFMPDGTPLIGETRTYEVTQTGQTFEELVIPYGEITEQ